MNKFFVPTNMYLFNTAFPRLIPPAISFLIPITQTHRKYINSSILSSVSDLNLELEIKIGFLTGKYASYPRMLLCLLSLMPAGRTACQCILLGQESLGTLV